MPTSLGKSSIGQRLADWMFGYDFFISYAWKDGRHYAKLLYDNLQDDGFTCFLDSEGYAKGDNWKKAGTREIRKTTQLILVLTPAAIISGPVLREVRLFTGLKRRMVPIQIGLHLPTLVRESALDAYIPNELLAICEPDKPDGIGPSGETIDSLKSSFTLVRQRDKRQRALMTTAIAMTVLAACTTYFWIYAQQQRVVAETNLRDARAQQLAASSQIVRLQPPESATIGLLLATEALRARHIPEAFDAWVKSASLLPRIEGVFESQASISWASFEENGGSVLFATNDGELFRWHWSGQSLPVLVAPSLSLDMTPTRLGGMLAFLGNGLELLGLDLSSQVTSIRAMPQRGSPISIVGNSNNYFFATEEGDVWNVNQAQTKVGPLYTSQEQIVRLDLDSQARKLLVVSMSEIVMIDLGSKLVTGRHQLSSPPLQVALHDTQEMIAVGLQNGKIAVLDKTSGDLISTIPAYRGRAVSHLRFLGDDRLIFANNSGRVRIVDIQSQLVLKTYHHNGIVNTMQVSGDDEFLVVGCADGNTYVWNLIVDELMVRPDLNAPVVMAHYDPINDILVHASTSKIVVRDMKSQNPFEQYSGTVPRIVSFASSTRSSTVAASGGVGAVRVFPNGVEGASRFLNTGVGNLPINVALSDDGEKLAAATNDYVGVWSTNDLTELFMIRKSVALSYTVEILGDFLFVGRADGTAEIWDMQSEELRWSSKLDHPVIASSVRSDIGLIAYAGQELWIVGINGEVKFNQDIGEQVTALAFSPSDSTIAVGTESGRVIVHNWRDERLVNDMQFGDEIRDLSYSSDGGYLAIAYGSFSSVTTAGKEMGYEIWDLTAKRSQTVLPHFGEVNAILFYSDDRVLTGGKLGRIRVWPSRLEDIYEEVDRRVSRKLNDIERERYKLVD